MPVDVKLEVEAALGLFDCRQDRAFAPGSGRGDSLLDRHRLGARREDHRPVGGESDCVLPMR